MEINKLTIHNIASIGDAVIEFNKYPLQGEHIFLISGDTGTGKSTILNAICLALYNTAPFMDDVKGNDKSGNTDNIAPTDPRNLMRTGSAEAYVELMFTGNDGKEYVAEWEVHRSHNKSTGSLQDVKRSLACNGVIIASKINEVKNCIAEPKIVGLTYEQFCRTTMLAQGQFTKFIKSDKKDKADILEKITGTEIYTAIGKKIYEKQKAAKDALTIAQANVGAVTIMSTQEVADTTADINRLNQQIIDEGKLLQELIDKFNWLDSKEKADNDLKTATDNIDALNKQLGDPTTKAKQATINLWDKTTGIRATLNSIKENIGQLADKQRELAGKRKGLETLLAGLEHLKNKLTGIKQEINRLTTIQTAESAHKTMYDNVQRIETLIDSIIEKGRIINTKQAEIAKAKVAQAGYAGKITAAQQALKDAEKALEQAENAVKQKVTAAQGVDINALRQKVNDEEASLKAIEKCREAIDTLAKKTAEKVAAHKALDDLTKEIGEATTKKEQNEALQPAAKREADRLRDECKGKMDLRDHLADLEKKFHETSTCPLCGSSVSGIHSDAVLNEEVAKAKQAADDAENRLKEIEKAVREAQTIIETTERQIGRAQEKVNQAEKDENDAKTEADTWLRPFGMRHDDIDVEEKLGTLKKSHEQAHAQASTAEKEGQAKLDAIEPARRVETKCREVKKNAQKTLDGLNNEVNKIEADINTATGIKNQAEDERASAAATLQPLLTIPVDLNSDDLGQLKRDIKGKADKYAKNQQRIDTCEREESNVRTIINTVTPRLNELSKDLQVSGIITPREVSDIDKALDTLSGEVNSLNGEIKTLEGRLLADEEKAKDFFANHAGIAKSDVEGLLAVSPQTIEDSRKEIREIEDNKTQAEGAKNSAQTTIDTLNQNAPNLAPGENKATVQAERDNKKQKIQNLSIEVGGKQNALTTDAANQAKQKTLIALRDELAEIFNKWEQLNNMFGTADGSRFREIAQSYVLRLLLEKANFYLKLLNKRYELTCAEGSLDISVIDHAQSDKKRSVSTLSGGEGFIVSLALCVGLSVIDKNKINVDTLFIDEGFGTLDNDYLEIVISMLERLHSIGGRRVGIISHVEQLATRIPTQIRVKQTRPGCSSIEVTTL